MQRCDCGRYVRCRCEDQVSCPHLLKCGNRQIRRAVCLLHALADTVDLFQTIPAIGLMNWIDLPAAVEDFYALLKIRLRIMPLEVIQLRKPSA